MDITKDVEEAKTFALKVVLSNIYGGLKGMVVQAETLGLKAISGIDEEAKEILADTEKLLDKLFKHPHVQEAIAQSQPVSEVVTETTQEPIVPVSIDSK